MDFKKLPNYKKAEIYREEFDVWKKDFLGSEGYFPVFQPFKDGLFLKKLSGNAVKLYLYLGLRSGNSTGETWVSIGTMAQYFGKTERTISSWLEELENLKLIKRMQMEPNKVSYTFLRPYKNESK